MHCLKLFPEDALGNCQRLDWTRKQKTKNIAQTFLEIFPHYLYYYKYFLNFFQFEVQPKPFKKNKPTILSVSLYLPLIPSFNSLYFTLMN